MIANGQEAGEAMVAVRGMAEKIYIPHTDIVPKNLTYFARIFCRSNGYNSGRVSFQVNVPSTNVHLDVFNADESMVL